MDRDATLTFTGRAGSAAVLVASLSRAARPADSSIRRRCSPTIRFDTKTKLKGDRQPVFPTGVPGTSSGVPQDLVKGYQPPPDQAADANAPDAAGKKRQKTNRSRKAARAPAQPPGVTAAAYQCRSRAQVKPRQPRRRERRRRRQQSQQSPFPPPPQTAPAQQAAPTVQSRWPDPPKSGTSSQ